MNEELEILRTELENYVTINAYEIPSYYDYDMKFKSANKIMSDVRCYIDSWQGENNCYFNEDDIDDLCYKLIELIDKIAFN